MSGGGLDEALRQAAIALFALCLVIGAIVLLWLV